MSALNDADLETLALIKHLTCRNEPEIDHGDPMDVDEMVEPSTSRKSKGVRRKDNLQMVRAYLESWRRTCWRRLYSNCAWAPNVLLPDQILTKIASRTCISTVSDMEELIPEWDFIDEHGEEVLEEVQSADSACAELKKQLGEEKAVKKARETAEKKTIRDEKRREEKHLETLRKRAAKELIKQETSYTWPLPVHPALCHNYDSPTQFASSSTLQISFSQYYAVPMSSAQQSPLLQQSSVPQPESYHQWQLPVYHHQPSYTLQNYSQTYAVGRQPEDSNTSN